MKRLFGFILTLVIMLGLPGICLAADPAGYDFTGSVIKMIGILLVLLALLIGGLKLAKKIIPGLSMMDSESIGIGIKVLGQLPLGSKRSLAVVKVGERFLMLGVTDQSINFITEVEERELDMGDVDELDSGRKGFGSILTKLTGGR